MVDFDFLLIALLIAAAVVVYYIILKVMGHGPGVRKKEMFGLEDDDSEEQ